MKITSYQKQLLEAIQIYKSLEIETKEKSSKQRYKNELEKLFKVYALATIKGW